MPVSYMILCNENQLYQNKHTKFSHQYIVCEAGRRVHEIISADARSVIFTVCLLSSTTFYNERYLFFKPFTLNFN